MNGEREKKIFEDYEKYKKYVVNVIEPLLRPINSGENKSGVLLEMRGKLWVIDQTRKRLENLKKKARAKFEKGKLLYVPLYAATHREKTHNFDIIQESSMIKKDRNSSRNS